ncbi:hypothetical protein DL346_01620 [Paenibacillus montanisoli]|uniref:Uncharacterized protein n=1 Tax=Paenibacillus montanisoli TaxID=2081970 RepID=A0A328UB02_9BACL|nr:hypothetical protein DL346_01620 [Paenibacillus montanisoli]
MVSLKKFLFWTLTIIFYIAIFLLYWTFFSSYPFVYLIDFLDFIGLDINVNITVLIINYLMGFVVDALFILLLIWIWKRKRIIFWLLFIVHAIWVFRLYDIVGSFDEPIKIRIENNNVSSTK